MSDETSAGLEEPLLQARERPALDGERQDEPAQEINQVVGDNPRGQGHVGFAAGCCAGRRWRPQTGDAPRASYSWVREVMRGLRLPFSHAVLEVLPK